MDMSIIIPCHNLENYIMPLLVSLQLQVIPYYDVELIFICDNCTDNTQKIIEEFDFNDLYEIIVLKRNVQSCGLARNEGLAVARGKYVWFIDGDDWLIDIYAVVKAIEAMILTKEPVIRFDYKCPKSFEWKGYPSMVWQYIYTRKLIGDTIFKEIQPDEDIEFQKDIFGKLPKTKRIVFMNELLYYYNYFREGSNMQQFRTTRKIVQ